MLVGIHSVSGPGGYRPPVRTAKPLPCPPQTIISLPVHTAVWSYRLVGTLMTLMAVQISVVGLYLAPLSNAKP